MDWSKEEIAGELGCDQVILDKFLDTLEYPEPPGGSYTEKDMDRIVNLWETTGAAEQMCEGR